MPFSLGRIGQIALPVHDVDKAGAFYERTLSFTGTEIWLSSTALECVYFSKRRVTRTTRIMHRSYISLAMT